MKADPGRRNIEELIQYCSILREKPPIVEQLVHSSEIEPEKLVVRYEKKIRKKVDLSRF